jgi:phosphopantetheinyl transferase (holo-ACP synthase)
MIGNDVVDILQARKESNWQRKGFIKKLFTTSEQILINTHSNPELMVWLFWSMKEAAYKIYNRQIGIRAFIPHKLECSLTKEGHITTGAVLLDNHTYFTRTTVSLYSIKTIATVIEANLDNIVETDTEEVLKDTLGLPYLVKHGARFPVSISHHGRLKQAVMLKFPI